MTAVSWCKAVRDVWQERSRSLLVVIAIAIGLAGFQAVLSTYAVLLREINRSYLDTNPASAVIFTDAVDANMLAAVRGRDDVADADARRVIGGRLRVGNGWRRCQLFVIRDFNALRISTVTSDGGEWPPSPGGVLIERDAFQVARAQIGDDVTIELATRESRRLRIVGAVHDAGQAQARMENSVYGYITPDTLAALNRPQTLDRLYLLAAGERFNKAAVQRMADGVRSWLQATGHPIIRVEVPEPGQHPHAVIMRVLLLAMALFGLLIVALSGVIAMNLFLAMMARERRQVGVMKATGATRAQITRIYLAESAMLGAAAIAIATPVGLIGGRAMSRYFGVLLNFDLASLAVPLWVYVLVVLVGLVVPLAAAAWPVLLTTRLAVREAIADVPAGAPIRGLSAFDRVLGSAALSQPIVFAIRNLARRPSRTALTLVTLAAGGACFIAAFSIRAAMMTAADRAFGAGTFGSIDRYAFDQHMLMIYVFLLIGAGVMAAVGTLGLITTASLNILERRREFGVLRAIGATPGRVAGLVMSEAAVLALLAWSISLTAAWVLTTAVARLLTQILFRRGLDASLSTPALVVWFVLSTALCVGASLVPALSASRLSIREATSHE